MVNGSPANLMALGLVCSTSPGTMVAPLPSWMKNSRSSRNWQDAPLPSSAMEEACSSTEHCVLNARAPARSVA
jgi:hypothetical protein